MMESVKFADILMILLVCGVIFAILKLVNRQAKQPQQKADQHLGETRLDAEDKKPEE